jgi:hypothetical protein
MGHHLPSGGQGTASLPGKDVVLWNYHNPSIGDRKPLPVALQIPANGLSIWDFNIFVDDGTPHPSMTMNMTIVHENGPLYPAETMHHHITPKDGINDHATANNTAFCHNRLDCHPPTIPIVKDKLGGW